MATYSNLRTSIDQSLPTNNSQFITAAIHRLLENELVDNLGRLQVRGIANPTQSPPFTDGPAAWFASTPGAYPSYGNTVVNANELRYIRWDGDGNWDNDLLLDTDGIGFVGSVADTNSIDLDVLGGQLTANVKLDTANNNDIVTNATGLFLNVQSTSVDDNENILGGGVGAATPLINLIDELAQRSNLPNYVANVGNTASITHTVTSGVLTSSIGQLGAGTVVDTNNLTGGGLGATVSLQSIVDEINEGGSTDILEGSDNGLLFKNTGGSTLAKLFYRLDEETLWFSKSNSLTWGNPKINSSVVFGTGVTGSQLTNPFASVLIGYNVAGVSVNGNSLTSVGYQSLNFLRDGFNVSAFGTDCGYNFRDVTNANSYGRHQFFTGDGSVLLDGTNINAFGVDSFPVLTSAANLLSFGNFQGSAATSAIQSIIIGDESARYKPSLTGSHIKGYQAAHVPSNPSGQVGLIAANIDGYRSMYNQHSLNYATARGYQAGYLNSYDVSYISTGTHLDGYQSGFNIYGLNNTFLGYRTGARTIPTNITGAIAIGYRAGDGWIGSNEFALDNNNTTTPLFYGNFSTNVAKINGTFQVSTVATDNTNTNVLVRNATTGALEINTTISGGGGSNWQTNGTDVWRVAGNVGVGIASPTFPLQVAGTISLTSSGNTIWLGNDSGSGFIRTFGSDKFTIRAASGLTTLMVDNVSSNVGIGTSSPSQDLHVVGNARITGAIYDSLNSPGTNGFIAQSTATGWNWIDPSTIIDSYSFSNGLTDTSGAVKLGGTLTELTTTITTGGTNTLLINHGNASTSQQSAWNSIGHTRLLSTTSTGQNSNYYHTSQSHILNAELPGTNKSTLAVVNGSVQMTSDNLTNNNLGLFNVFSSSIQLQMQDGTNTSSIITTPTTITISAVNVTAVPNQMVVGASAVEGSAALDVKSTTKAFYPPRMTTTQRNAISGIVNGAIVYNSTTNKFQGYANAAWVDFH